MEKVSIIIPVYNKDKYIRKCINSILKQSYENIEIIVIDDGSTDNSAKILDEFDRKYEKIRVIHKKNGGVSSARNVGLEYVKGDRIIFVDSDDYVNNDYVSSLLKDENADLNIINYTRIDKHKKELHQYNTNDQIEDISIENVLELIVSSGTFEGYLWNKSFRSEIISSNNIRFNEDIKVCEDLLFCVEYTKLINYASYFHHEAYYYTSNEDSAMFNNNYDISVLDAYRIIYAITDKFEKCRVIIIKRYMSSLVRIYFKNKRFTFNDYFFIKSEIKKYGWHPNFKQRLFYFLYPICCVLKLLF